MSNDESLIYYYILQRFTMSIFGILAGWKYEFCSFVKGYY